MVNRWLIGSYRFARLGRRVVLGPGRDPLPEKVDLFVRERWQAERHPRLLLSFEKRYEDAGRRTLFASGFEAFVGGKVQAALLHSRLVASLALALDDGPDVAEIADLAG